MTKTIVGLFTSLTDAQSAANDLMMNGFSAQDINIVTPQGDRVHPRQAQIGAELGNEGREEMGKGAAEGALAGGAIGGAAGVIAAAAGIAIPGLGAVLVAGPILAGLAGAGIGIAAGGIIGALSHIGIPEHEAHYYAEGVRRGGTLVTASTEDDATVARAADIMDTHGALDIEALAESLREEGWTGFEQPASTSVKVEEFGGASMRGHVYAAPVSRDDIGAGGKGGAGRSFEVSDMNHEPSVQKSDRMTREMAADKASSVRQDQAEDRVRSETGTGQRIRGARYAGPERRRVNNPFYEGRERRQSM